MTFIERYLSILKRSILEDKLRFIKYVFNMYLQVFLLAI